MVQESVGFLKRLVFVRAKLCTRSQVIASRVFTKVAGRSPMREVAFVGDGSGFSAH
jgi:hypothetical protein